MELKASLSTFHAIRPANRLFYSTQDMYSRYSREFMKVRPVVVVHEADVHVETL